MKRIQKGIALFGILLAAQIGAARLEAAGGGEQKPANSTITVISCGALWTTEIFESLKEFTDKTGITVLPQQLANDQISQKIAVSSTAKAKDLDVFAFRPLQETILFAKNGWLEPLDPYIQRSPDFDFNDIMESSKGSSKYDDKVYGIPILTEREVVFYNKELFDKAGIKTLPKTMDELMETARKLHDPSNNIFGIAIRGRGNDAVTMFSGFLRAFGGEFNANGKALINTPEALKAFEFYGELLKNYGPPGVLNMGWQETQALFAQGRAAMRIDADSQFGFSVDPKSSLIHDKVGYFMLPAGPAGPAPFNITAWSLGISPFSQNKEAAWEFINWAMDKEMDLRTQLRGNSSARTSTWNNSQATKNYPPELVAVINETSKYGRDTDRPSLINVAESRTIIGEVIMAAISGKDIKAAAEKANAAFQNLLDKEK
jgi:multiple sugar transport system substrate-binding protein